MKYTRSYIIQHNEAIEVDSIPGGEKTHKSWKYITWTNYKTGESIEILDKDYWKSAELMRLLLAKKGNPWLFALYVFLALSIMGVMWYFWYQFFQGNGGSIVPQINQEKNIVQNQTPSWSIPGMQKKPVEPVEIKEPEVNTVQLNQEIMDQWIYIESLLKEKTELEEKVEKLEQEKTLLQETVEKCNNNITELLEESNKKTKDGLIFRLGEMIDERCSKWIDFGTDKQKDVCQTLYTNYLKND